MKPPVAAIIQHIAFEGPAIFADVLEQSGFALRYLDAAHGHIDSDTATNADLLLILGGPIGITDMENFPVLTQEIAIIKNRLAHASPTLGICLGAQLIAHALGARITAGAAEIGWAPLTLTPAGEKSLLRHLSSPTTPVLHWHYDRLELPPGATRLASTETTPNQAFSIGNTLALQCHPEVTAADLEPWYIGHHHDIANNGALSVDQLRSDSEKYARLLEPYAKQMLMEWLQSVHLCGTTATA